VSCSFGRLPSTSLGAGRASFCPFDYTQGRLLSPVFCILSSSHDLDSIQFSYIYIIQNRGWPSSEFPAKNEGTRKRATEDTEFTEVKK
jgi:hypothetical protein